jgi:hypothetical protein
MKAHRGHSVKAFLGRRPCVTEILMYYFQHPFSHASCRLNEEHHASRLEIECNMRKQNNLPR